MANLSASANDHEGGISGTPDDLMSVAEKEAQTELDELKGEIQALKGELRLKNEEIDELHRIIGEMYVENKNRQPLF